LSSQESIEPSSEIIRSIKNQYDSVQHGQPESAVLVKGNNATTPPRYSNPVTEPLSLISAFENSDEQSVSDEQAFSESTTSILSAIELLDVLEQQMMSSVLADSVIAPQEADASDMKPEVKTGNQQSEVSGIGVAESSGAAFLSG
jgi:hypothetical protein